MPIKFCPKCNSILKIINENNEKYLACSKCNLKEKYTENNKILMTENFKQKKLGTGAAENNPKTGYEFKCPECGNDKCRVIDLGIMYGDEDWIYLLQCTKCDYGERVGEMC